MAIKLTKEKFVEKANKIHGDKYDYSKVEYINSQTKVCIICPIHGEFWQTPNAHLNGRGCKKCANKRRADILSKTQEEFLKELKKIHGDKYDTSKVKYINSTKKVCIVCHEKDENGIEHVEFWQEPNKLLKGHGCPKCKSLKLRKKFSDDMETFIEKAKKIHNNKYVYFSEETYINNRTPIKIKCKKHGIFYQKPNSHLNGHGCPVCRESKLEKEIYTFLQEKNINFIYQANKRILEWLGKQSLDFYLPDYNIAIECQGEQHFTPTTFGSTQITPEEYLQQIIKRDKQKLQLCNEHNIKILYYTNKIRGKYFGKIYTYKNKLFKNIKL